MAARRDRAPFLPGLLAPAEPKAIVLLFAGGHGGVRLRRAPDGDVAVADGLPVPGLLVHHTRDRCGASDFRDMRKVMARLQAPRKEQLAFSGGPPAGPPCEAYAYHGFNGIEGDVVAAIARWILQ